MNISDDALLSSYLDGELHADKASELERRLENDADLRSRLDAMRAADDATRQLFDAIDDAPIPDAVLQMLAGEQHGRDNVVAIPLCGLGRFFQAPVAIAASVALAVGFMVSELVQQPYDTTSPIESLGARLIQPESDLHRMLENDLSGQVENLAGNARGQVLLTFKEQSGTYCRQLRVDTADESAHGVACRHDGTWQIEALAYTDPTPGGQFQPAASAIPFNITATIDNLIGPGNPLEIDQEKQAISTRWENE